MKGMPSPVGHALGGIIAGGLISKSRDRWTLGAVAVAGALPDIDFLLPLPHRGPTHSLGATLLVFLLGLLALRPRSIEVRLIAAIAVAYGSHVLLDWLGKDTWTPHGLMVLWPVTDDYYSSGWNVFAEINRRYWQPGFWSGNLLAVLREVAILILPALIVLRTGRRR